MLNIRAEKLRASNYKNDEGGIGGTGVNYSSSVS